MHETHCLNLGISKTSPFSLIEYTRESLDFSYSGHNKTRVAYGIIFSIYTQSDFEGNRDEFQ